MGRRQSQALINGALRHALLRRLQTPPPLLPHPPKQHRSSSAGDLLDLPIPVRRRHWALNPNSIPRNPCAKFISNGRCFPSDCDSAAEKMGKYVGKQHRASSAGDLLDVLTRLRRHWALNPNSFPRVFSNGRCFPSDCDSAAEKIGEYVSSAVVDPALVNNPRHAVTKKNSWFPRKALNPNSVPWNSCTRFFSNGRWFPSEGDSATEKIGEYVSSAVVDPALVNNPRNLVTENYWFPRKAFLPGFGGGSRGFASLVEKPRSSSGERVDEAGVAEEAAGGGGGGGGRRREQQGREEGVSASVSGEVAPVKRQRKRKSLIQEVEVVIPEDVVPSARADLSAEVKQSELVGRDSSSSTSSSSDLDNVLPKPTRGARRKRSKEISGENILRAFNGTPEVVQHQCQGVLESTLKPPWPALGASGKKPLEISAGGQQPELAEMSPSVSSTASGPVKGDTGGKMKENGGLGAGKTAVSAGLDRPQFPQSQHRAERFIPGSTAVSEISEAAAQQVRAQQNRTSRSVTDAEHLATHASVRRGSENMEERNNDVSESAAAAAALTKPAVSSVGGEGGEAHGAEFSNPKALYQALVDSKGGRVWQGYDRTRLHSIFYRFSASGWVSDQALSLYINSKFFLSAASKFRKFFMHKSPQELRNFVISKGATNEAVQFLFPVFAEFCIHEFPTEINRYRELVNTADMTKPDAWYPFARAMKRKVVYHKGPTNSGKTFNALTRYMEASSGIYCSPLRLLAMEVFDTVNMKGVYCNLHTGQEKKDVPFANHLACTVEMCYLTQQWEVAVIDEIQMMSDEYRGWAWTRAFLGLQADEIHVCGDPSALPLIRNLCSGTGDDLVEYEYERFVPLKVAEESLRGDFRNIEAGDCIVAFSRRDIFDIKREVELASKHRCCVVYGALPPETRTQQAKLFNEADNGYDVLVASDAIGMGLNLNIRRVVFFALDKFDGDSKKAVPAAQVKQIAGRAGRRGSLYPNGVTTTFFSQDLSYLGSSMLQDFEPATAAGLFPVYEQVELFASQLPNVNFAKLLERFSETCRLDGAFFLCRYDNLKRVANMLEKVKGLSLEDRFNFCFAPVNVRDPESMGALYRYATAFSQKIPVHVEMGVPSSSARDEFELLDLEARHQALSMYLWLSQHFRGDLFPEREQAGEMASQIAVLLGQSLVQSSRRWAKRKLSPQHRRRPLPRTGRPDARLATGWTDGRPNSAENLIRA